MPLISVIVPIFNGASYIQRCVSSLLCQTLADIEIIAVDDGSLDAGSRILDMNAELNKNIRVIHQKHSGFGNALNVGLETANGEYVGFLPVEWSARPEAYGSLYKKCLAYDLDAIKCGYSRLIDENIIDFAENGGLHSPLIIPQKEPNLVFADSVPWRGLYKKSFLDAKNITFSETPWPYGQESGFGLKILCAAKNIWIMPDKLFYCSDPDFDIVFPNPHTIDAVRNEFADAMAYAKAEKSPLLPFIQKRSYLFLCDAYDKLRPRLRKEFVKKVGGDFRRDIRNRMFNRSLYTRKEKLKYLSLAFLPHIFRLQRRIKSFLR